MSEQSTHAADDGTPPASSPSAPSTPPTAVAPPSPADADGATPASPFDPPGVSWTPVSPRLMWVRLTGELVATAVALVIGVVLWLVLDTWVPLLIAAPFVVLGILLAFVVPAQVRSWGYAERQEDLLVRHGVMFRTLNVVPYGRMQYVDVNAGPLDRMLGLATVRLHTASAGTDAAIPGLTRAEASRLRDRLSEAGQAQLAGL